MTAAVSTEKAPLVSVLVPIYNVQRYLEQCLESLRTQTLQDFEVICIDDGSTDASPAIIERYVATDARFRVITKPNGGYGQSMNIGLAAATGRYLTILESDDFIEPQALQILADTIQGQQAEVVKANCYLHWSKQQSRDKLCWLVPPSQVGRLINPQENPEILYLKPAIWAAIYDLGFLRRHNIGFLETPGASYQDASFNFKVWACAQRAFFLRQAFVHYRQDNEASSVLSPDKLYCVCDEYLEMVRFLAAAPEFADDSQRQQRQQQQQRQQRLTKVLAKMRYDSYLWNYQRLGTELRPVFLQRFQADFLELAERGDLDLSSFEPWKALDLQTIMESPERYHAQRQATGDGYLGKLRHAFNIGGPGLVLAMVWEKLTRR